MYYLISLKVIKFMQQFLTYVVIYVERFMYVICMMTTTKSSIYHGLACNEFLVFVQYKCFDHLSCQICSFSFIHLLSTLHLLFKTADGVI